jgi:membrane protein DedA with SNARE-associated domain
MKDDPAPFRCLMSMIKDALLWVEPAIATYGAFALFLTIYLESFGVPLPGESGLIAAALLATRGDLDIGHVFLAAWLGGVLGDSTGYLIGRFGGRPLLQRFGGYFRLTPERLSGWEQTAQRGGFVLVLTARFVVVLRQLTGLLAGSVNMPWPKFALANVLGAALWAGSWTLAPYLFTDLFHRAL